MTPNGLVNVVADAIGIDLPSLVWRDQQLAKARLRTVGGRGRNAAKMDEYDAAALVISALDGVGGEPSQNAADRTEALLSAVLMPANFTDRPGLPAFAAITNMKVKAEATLHDALAALIADLGDSNIAKRYAPRAGKTPRVERALHLVITRPDNWATISLPDDCPDEFAFSALTNTADKRPWQVQIEVGAGPLIKIAKALRAE